MLLSYKNTISFGSFEERGMDEDMGQAGRAHVYEVGPAFGKVELGLTAAFCDLSTKGFPGAERCIARTSAFSAVPCPIQLSG